MTAETVEVGPEAARSEADGDRTGDHLDDVDPGAGCTEIWEYLSERRADDSCAVEAD